jgi:hypothetical protein
MPEIVRSLWIRRALEHMKVSSAMSSKDAKLLQVLYTVLRVLRRWRRLAARRADA